MIKSVLAISLLSLSLFAVASEETVNLKGVEDFVLKDMTDGGKRYLCTNAIKGDKIKIKVSEATGRITAVVKCTESVWVADRANQD